MNDIYPLGYGYEINKYCSGSTIGDHINEFSSAVTTCNEDENCRCFYDLRGTGEYSLRTSTPLDSTGGSNAWVKEKLTT